MGTVEEARADYVNLNGRLSWAKWKSRLALLLFLASLASPALLCASAPADFWTGLDLLQAMGFGMVVCFFLWLIVRAGVPPAQAKATRALRYVNALEKYGDPQIAANIADHMIWAGATEEQLTESWGRPVSVDQKLLKTKTKEVWKYNRTGKNRYGSRVTLENGEVVGWEQKGG